jgi:hypothetical protein
MGLETGDSCQALTDVQAPDAYKSTLSYAFLRALYFSHFRLPAPTTHTLHHNRERDRHSPGGVHAFLRVQHSGRRMLFIRFVNRAVQAVRRSHHEGRKQARDSGHSPFRGPARGRSPRARIPNLCSLSTCWMQRQR